jgi:hypothetical protein
VSRESTYGDRDSERRGWKGCGPGPDRGVRQSDTVPTPQSSADIGNFEVKGYLGELNERLAQASVSVMVPELDGWPRS